MGRECTVLLQLPFEKNCGQDHLCEGDLSVNLSFSGWVSAVSFHRHTLKLWGAPILIEWEVPLFPFSSPSNKEVLLFFLLLYNIVLVLPYIDMNPLLIGRSSARSSCVPTAPPPLLIQFQPISSESLSQSCLSLFRLEILVVGSSLELNVIVMVSNEGEDSYGTVISFYYPAGLSYRRTLAIQVNSFLGLQWLGPLSCSRL